MSLQALCDQMSFVINGGVLALLEERLGAEPGAALVLQETGKDLAVAGAVRFVPGAMVFSDGSPVLDGPFPRPPAIPACSFEAVGASPDATTLFGGRWCDVVRLAGGRWRYYVLLSEPLTPALRGDLGAFARLLAFWQDHQTIPTLETRLSRLSYTLMAARNAISSIFEPMPVEYFAAFLGDVLRESVFARRLSVVEDGGGRWRPLWGEPRFEPRRQGLFKETRTLPTPLAVDEEHRAILGDENLSALRALGIHAVLPLAGGGVRLFCFVGWEAPPSEEDLHFLALFVHVASKALEITALHRENQEQVASVSAKIFALEGLHASTLHLMRQRTRGDLLDAACDILAEMSQAERVVLVAWKPQAEAYVLHAVREAQGERQRTDEVVHRGMLPGDGGMAGVLEGPSREAFCRTFMPGLEDLGRRYGVDRLLLLADERACHGVVGFAPSVTGERYGDATTLATLAGTVAVGLERCHLLERVTENRDALDRRLLFLRLLRDIAGKVQEIKSLDLLCESVEESLRLALGARPPYIILRGDPNSGRAELLAMAERLETPKVVSLPSGRPMLLTPLWSGRRCWGTIAVASLDGMTLHSEEAEELFSLVAPLVAPRLASLLESASWRHRNVVDLEALAREEVRRERERLDASGMDAALIVRPGRKGLNPVQEEMARLVLRERDRTLCLVPFGWDEEMQEIFPPGEGWVLWEDQDSGDGVRGEDRHGDDGADLVLEAQDRWGIGVPRE